MNEEDLQKALGGSREQQAFRLMKDAADNNYAPAQTKLAEMLQSGIGVEKSEALSLLYLQRAAIQGDQKAKFQFAIHLETGTPHLPQDKRKALALFRECGDAGKVPVSRLLQESAEEGSTSAMMELVDIFKSADGVPPSLSMALKYLQAAAEADNNPETMIQVADWFDRGQGVEEDPVAAVRWLRRAADCNGGCLDAICKLGETYITGRGHQYADLEKAFKYLKRASDKAHARANFQLAMIFRKGHGVGGPNDEESVKYMTKAADLGYLPAEEKLRRWERAGISSGYTAHDTTSEREPRRETGAES